MFPGRFLLVLLSKEYSAMKMWDLYWSQLPLQARNDLSHKKGIKKFPLLFLPQDHNMKRTYSFEQKNTDPQRARGHQGDEW